MEQIPPNRNVTAQASPHDLAAKLELGIHKPSRRDTDIRHINDLPGSAGDNQYTYSRLGLTIGMLGEERMVNPTAKIWALNLQNAPGTT